MHSAAFGRNPIVGPNGVRPRPSAARPYDAFEMFARKAKNYDLVSQSGLMAATKHGL
jgi:hypothetical protein